MSVRNVENGQGMHREKEEQLMVGPKYCSKVLMGNWNEDLILREEKIKHFVRKKENGELLVQKTRAMLSNLFKEVQLLQPNAEIAFGQTCQVLAPCLGLPRAEKGLALAGVVGPKEVDACQHFQEGSIVSGTPLVKPVVRNCFQICSPDQKCRDGEPLNYGEPFTLATLDSPHGLPMFIESEVPHLQSVLGKSKHPLLRLCSFKNIYSLWKVIPLEPSVRPDLWDTPVPRLCANSSRCDLVQDPNSWKKVSTRPGGFYASVNSIIESIPTGRLPVQVFEHGLLVLPDDLVSIPMGHIGHLVFVPPL